MAEEYRSEDRILEFIMSEGRIAESWWREPILLVVGYLNIYEDPSAPKLIKRIAGLAEREEDDMSLKPGDSRLTLFAAELAAIAFLEWGKGGNITQARLARRLAALLNNPDITEALPTLRAEAGRALARLGDPRDDVVKLPPKLTEAWLEGEFLYGENNQKRVIKQPFKAGLYPITHAQYREFVSDGGYDKLAWWSDEGGKAWLQQSREKQPRYWDQADFNQPNQPVVGVSYYEAEAFCNWLTEMDGEKQGLKYRLPTEEEWERLARGQDGREYPWGNEWREGLANTSESGIGRTCAVGLFPGGMNQETRAHNCAGNVWEWCADWYDEEHIVRALRGGSWYNDGNDARCASRDGDYPDNWSISGGFRVVVSPIK